MTGFSLLETLLVVAIIGILANMSFPVYLGLIRKNNLDNTTANLVSSMRRAQFLSQSVANDSPWGVNISGNKIVVFMGESYATRNTAFDEEITFSDGISINGLSEVAYSKFLGMPVQSGTLTLSVLNDTRVVAINNMGMIEY